tara:strand:+ start:93 stop:497 length:405 start_codon:yes stop_codon:yes gene_type:complete
MIDAFGLHNNNAVNTRSASSMVPAMSQFDNISNNNIKKPIRNIYTPVGKVPSILNDITARDPTKKVLPAKGNPESIRFGRVDSSLTGGMQASTGFARKQPMGLATLKDLPMDRPILPIAGFYDINQVNVLGNLR